MSVHVLDWDARLLLDVGLISLGSLGWGFPGLRTVWLGPDRGARRADALPWNDRRRKTWRVLCTLKTSYGGWLYQIPIRSLD